MHYCSWPRPNTTCSCVLLLSQQCSTIAWYLAARHRAGRKLFLTLKHSPLPFHLPSYSALRSSRWLFCAPHPSRLSSPAPCSSPKRATSTVFSSASPSFSMLLFPPRAPPHLAPSTALPLCHLDGRAWDRRKGKETTNRMTLHAVFAFAFSADRRRPRNIDGRVIITTFNTSTHHRTSSNIPRRMPDAACRTVLLNISDARRDAYIVDAALYFIPDRTRQADPPNGLRLLGTP